MPAPIDLTGEQFGKLKVLGLLDERDQLGKRLWQCQCDCGGLAVVDTSTLRSGHTRSCGCRHQSFPVKIGHWTWLNEHECRDAKRRLWWTLKGCKEKCPGVPRKSVERWGDPEKGVPCRFLTDTRGRRRFITTKRVRPPSPRAVGKVRVCLAADIMTIDEHMGTGQPAGSVRIDGCKRWTRQTVHSDKDGRTWLTEVQMMDKHGVHRGFFA